MTETNKYGVLFVCLGNICRSPAAQAVMQRMVDERGLSERFFIDSAGIGGWHIGDLPDKRMCVHARPRGYELTHRARRVQANDFEDFDLIVGMDSWNLRGMHHICGGDPHGKIRLLMDFTKRPGEVADPWYTGNFEATWRDVLEGCQGILNQFIWCASV